MLLVCWVSPIVLSAQVDGNAAGAPADSVTQPARIGLPPGEAADKARIAELGPTMVEARSSHGPHLKRPKKYDIGHIGDRGIGGGVNFYSLEKERALGKEMADEIDAQVRFIDDPEITEYVNRVVQNIVRHSDARVPFSVKVISDEEVNTFALPGGFLYVNSGLLLAADDEASLAGVLAHEIAHVAARHATKQLTRRTMFDLASIPLMFVSGGAVVAVREAMNVAVPLAFLKFSRNSEREADLLAIEYAYAAGYDPVSFVQFFERLKTAHKQKLAFIAGAFATHPMTEDRIKRAQIAIATMLPEKSDYVVTTSEFDHIRARLMAITHQTCRSEPGRPMLRGGAVHCRDQVDDGTPHLEMRPKPQ